MTRTSFIVGLCLVAILLVNPSHAQDSDDTCPYPQGRTIEDLAAELAAHQNWVDRRGWNNPDITGRANFCNADLSAADLQEADLIGANLQGTNLQGAFLRQANLQGADLFRANLQEAFPTGADLQGANLKEANLQRANLFEANLRKAVLTGTNLQGAQLVAADLQEATLSVADLKGANLSLANLQGADLLRANLQGASLFEANLQGAVLTEANLQGADLFRANLQGAFPVGADLQGANLKDANLQGADLFNANLQEAILTGANLQGAILTGANLQNTRLDQSVLSNAVLYQADLSRALYQPATAPASGSLSGIIGLESVWYCPGEASGLVQLREALKEAGLRDSERVVTNTLESIRTDYAFARWNGLKFEDEPCSTLERDRMAAIEGVFRLVFFEWPTAYGLAYGRPILILLALIGVFTVVYLPALLIPPKSPVDSGIFRIWPEGRIKQEGPKPVLAEDVVIERLKPRGLSALGLAFYFSVISAFHLGWRDLNVGTWIARLQPREYALRAKGWVRVVSGVQSLISVYLVAMWVLTYFGRPFG